ncbi:MAG: hypothetical protein AB9869_30510 [Verrucomicrobiia bacterium]
MKHHYPIDHWTTSALVGLALTVCTGTSLAATDLVLGTFDSDVAGWGTAWGNATAIHDPMEDNTGNGGGACYIAADFSADQNTLTIYGCVEGNPWSHPTSANFNLSDYKSLEFDIKWDTTSSVSVADFNTPPQGGEGGIAIWSVDYPGFSIRPTLATIQVPADAATAWAHVSVPIDPSISGIDPSKGIVLKKWITEAQRNAGGNYGFWVDNVTLKGSDAPPPPPTLSLDKPTPGLAFVAASGGQWDRQNIRTVGDGYSWVGATGPVSYSLTVADYADMAGFQFHMYFVPGTPDPARADPDWHEPNVLSWTIGGNADGSAYSAVHYKTNAPDDNGILYGDGNLGGAGSTTPTGTWTILFDQNTSITTISPSGETNSAALPPEVVPAFEGPMKIYVGIVPGDPARVGQMAVLSRLKISGLPASLESDFLSQSLDTNVWEINAASPLGVQQIPTDAAYWVDWTLPALDFALEGAAAVTGPWRSPAPTGFDVGGKHRVLLRTSDLPGENAGFWRLNKRSFTKLQVLLPGETAAPETSTGKTGSPIAQTAGVEFDVIVNAVDDNWNLTTGGRDNVRLTSTDDGAFLPGDTALVRGTVTIRVTLNTPGSWTITATDVTDESKTASTSSAVTVQ